MKLKSTTKSILQELFEQNTYNDFEQFENKADHVLSSVINLIDYINNMDLLEEEKDSLNKRILLSIKNKNAQKTTKYIRLLRDKYKEQL